MISNELLFALALFGGLSISLGAFYLGRFFVFVLMVTITLYLGITEAKVIEVFGWPTTIGTALFGVLMLSTDMLSERYGRKAAFEVTFYSIFAVLCFQLFLKITLLAAFLVALPVVLYQVWAFVAPGLYSHEKKMVLPLVISSTMLFVVGVAFCYFLVIPGMSKFIQAFAPTSITAAPDIEQYFGFVLTLFLVFGIAFEVPIAVIVLVRIGVVTIDQLKKARGYFIVGAFIVAAVVTPPDVISQLALAIPMCILYELGIVAARIFAQQTQAPGAEAQAGDKPAG